MIHHQVIILGGGASGLMASILCKDFGLDAALIEGNDRVGKKILTTGNGRCNITNKYIEKPFNRYHSSNLEFFHTVLNNFDVNSTIDFFYSLGLPLAQLEEGKMYPLSLQASSVLDIFRMSLEDREIPIYLNSKIIEIKHSNNEFSLKDSKGELYKCKKLILACGGKSAPSTGSDGSGFKLAKSLGHNILGPVPSLVQLKLDYPHLKALSGIKFNGTAEILVNGDVKRQEYGEILFTDYGISGPPILQLSRVAAYGINHKEDVSLNLDMMYTMSLEEVENFLEGRWAMFSYRSVYDSFIGVINKKLIPTLLKEAGIMNIHKPCSDLTWSEKKSIYNLLKCWKFKVTDTNNFNNSQVTAGGINTKEVWEETLESKIIKDLYFCGEILDVDGDCGGYNLQWAWSSAYAAAKACKNSSSNP